MGGDVIKPKYIFYFLNVEPSLFLSQVHIQHQERSILWSGSISIINRDALHGDA